MSSLTADRIRAELDGEAGMGGKPAWKNRIVGEGIEHPDQLMANPKNWRVHPKAQQEALQGVLEEVGWVQRVIVNQRTNTLVDGHLRVSLALKNNEPAIPVLYVDLSDDEEALILATIDPIAELAVADKDKLDELLHEVSTGSPAVQAMLADLRERHIPDNAPVDPHEPGEQEEPSLASEVLVEIYCGTRDLEEMQPYLDKWAQRAGVTVNIS